jgi:pimeloyl-ACP methyl ester carboxylesterase
VHHILTPEGVTVSYDRYGAGPPLVVVHGAFSDHLTNWEFAGPLLAARFSVHAVARRGRGETDATEHHRLEDEARDVVALLEAVGEPAYLLGHSYGAHVALAAARQLPERVRKLVLYEPPWPSLLDGGALSPLAALADRGDWNGFAIAFFTDLLAVPAEELEALRASPLWPPIVGDAPASFRDLQALQRYDFRVDAFGSLSVPVLLQAGSESPRELYVTDALAAVLPDAVVAVLEGQAHEAMTTAPAQYAEAVIRYFLEEDSKSESPPR